MGTLLLAAFGSISRARGAAATTGLGSSTLATTAGAGWAWTAAACWAALLQVGAGQLTLVLADAHVVARGALAQDVQAGFGGLQLAAGDLRRHLVEAFDQLVHGPVVGAGFAQQQAQGEHCEITVAWLVHYVTRWFCFVLGWAKNAQS